MSFLKDAFDWIKLHGKVATIEDGPRHYSDRQLHPITLPTPRELDFNNLSGFCHFVNKEFGKDQAGFVRVYTPTKVIWEGALDSKWNSRPTFAVGSCLKFLPSHHFGEWMSQEDFIIYLHSGFVAGGGDVEALLRAVSGIKKEALNEMVDDGVSQKFVAKRGIDLQRELTIQNPVTLNPYSTFPELAQPEQKMVFRINGDRSEPVFKLSTTGSAAHKIKAMNDARDYLRENLDNKIPVFA